VPPLGGPSGNVHSSSVARWKARGRLLVPVELFCQFLWLMRYEQILVEIVVFEMGVGHFEHKFQGNWVSLQRVRKLESLAWHCLLEMLRLAVLILYRRVTNAETQTHDDG